MSIWGKRHQTNKAQHGFNRRAASLHRNTTGATEPYQALPEDKLRYTPLRPPLAGAGRRTCVVTGAR